uniref:Ubiquitin-like domain-containing protein n=1 Tax=Astatotilapia calliptera TaxID=8154 RepID=A0AAX7SLD4_ASTCA
MADEKPKESVKTENNEHINLKVAGQDGSVVQFKIKRHTPLIKLMKAYCERQGLSMRQIRFRFDGQPINETDTPAQMPVVFTAVCGWSNHNLHVIAVPSNLVHSAAFKAKYSASFYCHSGAILCMQMVSFSFVQGILSPSRSTN